MIRTAPCCDHVRLRADCLAEPRGVSLIMTHAFIPIPMRHWQPVLVCVQTKNLQCATDRSICRLLKLTQQRRELKCPKRVDGCFPTPFRTEALHTGVLVCLKDRVKACVSNAFGEIFNVHIAPIERRLSISLHPQTGIKEARQRWSLGRSFK
jgi:hypothetical protein